jgi:hypothetical protein
MSLTIPISKLDAAKRQLETAIRLFFKEEDPVSVHTLSAAAYDILHPLCKSKGIKEFVKNTEMIRKERRKEYLRMINSTQNFFKHGARDKDQIHHFHYEATPFFIWDACNMYFQLTGERPKELSIFNIWFYLRDPDMLLDSSTKETLIKAAAGLDPSNRRKFYLDASQAFDMM